jgi:hypothetical protein
MSLALGLLAFLCLKDTPKVAAEDKSTPLKPASLGQAYECTAIGEVIKANGGKVPRNGTELIKALARCGDFAQIPVPFSAVALDSGLTHPRVVIAPRPGRAHPGTKDEEEPANPPEGINPPKPAPGVKPKPPRPLPEAGDNPFGIAAAGSPLSTAKVAEVHFEGRLYLAANMEKLPGENPKVKTIEFISWNSRRTKFDFGVIDCSGPEPEIQILDGVRCFACHKNRGPILSQGPWSNTTHNDHVRTAAITALLGESGPKANPADNSNVGPPGGFGVFGAVPAHPSRAVSAALRQKTTFDGISLVVGQPEMCDASIRLGGELARDREIYRVMARSADGRKALAILMAAIASSQPIEQSNQQVKQAVDLAYNVTFGTFADDFVNLTKSMSSTLADFSPSGSVGTLKNTVTRQPTGWGGGSTQQLNTVLTFSGDPKMIAEYDTKRSNGEHGMPSSRMPSNPRSFIRTTMPVPPRPSAAVNAMNLARLIGITEGDRQFMSKALTDLVQSINKPKVTATTLARDLFGGPAFTEVLKAGNIPDREDFKDRFVEGLIALAKTHKVEAQNFPRGDYASGPNCAPGKDDKEPVIVPTTACLHCHDIRGVAKQSAFNPIPMLAFDPFDKQARDNWVKSNDAKKREVVLSRMLKRLVTDRDMPPEDSAEYERFRQKEAAAFDAVKDWLESELKKVKVD